MQKESSTRNSGTIGGQGAVRKRETRKGKGGPGFNGTIQKSYSSLGEGIRRQGGEGYRPSEKSGSADGSLGGQEHREVKEGWIVLQWGGPWKG